MQQLADDLLTSIVLEQGSWWNILPYGAPFKDVTKHVGISRSAIFRNATASRFEQALRERRVGPVTPDGRRQSLRRDEAAAGRGRAGPIPTFRAPRQSPGHIVDLFVGPPSERDPEQLDSEPDNQEERRMITASTTATPTSRPLRRRRSAIRSRDRAADLRHASPEQTVLHPIDIALRPAFVSREAELSDVLGESQVERTARAQAHLQLVTKAELDPYTLGSRLFDLSVDAALATTRAEIRSMTSRCKRGRSRHGSNSPRYMAARKRKRCSCAPRNSARRIRSCTSSWHTRHRQPAGDRDGDCRACAAREFSLRRAMVRTAPIRAALADTQPKGDPIMPRPVPGAQPTITLGRSDPRSPNCILDSRREGR